MFIRLCQGDLEKQRIYSTKIEWSSQKTLNFAELIRYQAVCPAGNPHTYHVFRQLL